MIIKPSSLPADHSAPKAFTLVETLVAISLLTIAVVAPMSLTTQSLAGAYYARDQVTAYFLAQEAIEGVRSARDNNVLRTALGTPTDLLAGIPATDGRPFTIDVRYPSVMHLCSGACTPLQTQVPNSTLYGYSASPGVPGAPAAGWQNTSFTRSVSATYVPGTSNNEIKISVTVSWQTAAFQRRTFTITENLYRWIDDSSSPGSLATVWVDDALPSGATPIGATDGWNWISSNPAAFNGTLSHQSAILAGLHEHYFQGATQVLPIAGGESLFAYVFLDPSNPPTEIMLQFNNGTWEHRAYWGANSINLGTNGTDSRRYMGALPPAGLWVKLSVPASQIGVEGSSLNGMSFTLFGGRASWDMAGKE